MESNKEALREFLRGAALTVAMTVGIGLVIASFGRVEKGPVEKFKVVDNYSGCAVIKYTPPNRAESVYFLDCQHYRD